jgi:hypothetical protein
MTKSRKTLWILILCLSSWWFPLLIFAAMLLEKFDTVIPFKFRLLIALLGIGYLLCWGVVFRFIIDPKKETTVTA